MAEAGTGLIVPLHGGAPVWRLPAACLPLDGTRREILEELGACRRGLMAHDGPRRATPGQPINDGGWAAQTSFCDQVSWVLLTKGSIR